jgi:hypothetical protein
LKIYTTFKDVQMILKRFYDISTGFRFQRSVWECSVHICSCPCPRGGHPFALAEYFSLWSFLANKLTKLSSFFYFFFSLSHTISCSIWEIFAFP